MNANLVKLDFGKAHKNAEAKKEINSAENNVTGLFAGYAQGKPSLLDADIMRDIQSRIEQSEALGDAKIVTRNFLRGQAIAAAYENLQEAEMRFYLQKEDTRENYPFLVLRAEHKKDYAQPGKVDTVYTLAQGLSTRHRRCTNAIKGYNYHTDIAPYISQKLTAAVASNTFDNGWQAYEAWTPNQ